MNSQVHPKERVYFILLTIMSIFIYAGLIFSKIGLVYIPLGFLILTFMHGVAVGHMKGNGVQITEQQFPEIYNAIQDLSSKLEIYPVPEAYIQQAGGLINAFASRLSRRDIIILTSEIVELAYQGKTEALRFVIAHELGHIKRKHSFWRMTLFPGMLVPYLGKAYSRACEFTCDAIAADLVPNGAVDGLLVLSAGKKLPQYVDVNSFVAQVNNDNSIWVSFAELFSTHPILPKRVAAVLKWREQQPQLNEVIH